MLPAPSTATPEGLFKFAAVACPPSPQTAVEGEQGVPFPAMVVIVPVVVSIWRTLLFAESAMYILVPNTATDWGVFSSAWVAGPPSPPKPPRGLAGAALPATFVSTPVVRFIP